MEFPQERAAQKSPDRKIDHTSEKKGLWQQKPKLISQLQGRMEEMCQETLGSVLLWDFSWNDSCDKHTLPCKVPAVPQKHSGQEMPRTGINPSWQSRTAYTQLGMGSMSQELKSDMACLITEGPTSSYPKGFLNRQIHYRMSCRNCCFTGRSWPLTPFLTSPHNKQRLQEDFTHLGWHRGLCCHHDLPGTSLPLSVISGTEKQGGLCLSMCTVAGQFPVLFQLTNIVYKASSVYFI